MKNFFLLGITLFAFSSVQAQNNSTENQKRNEFKLNVVFPLFGTFEATYERHLTDKSAVGISGLYVFNNDKSNEDMNYMFSPYYRRYFGKKQASGLFVEGFGAVSSIDGEKIYDTPAHTTFTKGDDVIDFSLGLGIGSKWVTKSGFVFEVNARMGKLLFNSGKTDHTHVARFGFHVGYTF
ncbi:DUF3575 domain-containing protein [Myroides odoratus]|uniref:DUF3575 domain-containing protein n=1 Tax=Myroides odoratus TaxID=256 RepID=UPI0039AF11C3